MENNVVKQKLKAFIADNGYTFRQIVKLLNELHPEEPPMAPSTFTNKLTRGSIRYVEVMELADVMGYTVEFIPKDGRKVYFPTTEEAANEKELYETEFLEKSESDVQKIESKNFGHAVISGENAELAALWMTEKLKTVDTKVDEILLFLECKKIFEVLVRPTNA